MQPRIRLTFICVRQLGSDCLTVSQMAELQRGRISLFRFISSAEQHRDMDQPARGMSPASQRHEPGPELIREVQKGVQDEPGTGLKALGWAEMGS